MGVIDLVAYREKGALIPWGDAAQRDFDDIPLNKLLMLGVHQPRNPEHHNKYWAICQRVCDFCDEFSVAEDVSDWVKLRLRMIKEFKDWDGRIVFRPQSISYASMDQIKFERFYARAMWVLAERLGFDPEELLPDRRKAA